MTEHPTLSEAIWGGSQLPEVDHQCFRGPKDGRGGYCALAAASLYHGNHRHYLHNATIIRCQQLDFLASTNLYIGGDLNDERRWTFDQIAWFVEQVEQRGAVLDFDCVADQVRLRELHEEQREGELVTSLVT